MFLEKPHILQRAAMKKIPLNTISKLKTAHRYLCGGRLRNNQNEKTV